MYAYISSANAQTIVNVGDETALRNAISSATGHTIIVLTADIQLTTTPLNIVAGKDIVLTSNSPSVFFRLIGASGQTTITVANNGRLELVGITVTHTSGTNGNGAVVYFGGVLTLSGGTITNNYGGGIANSGDFTMSGGTITNNTSLSGGGGILNHGNFAILDGTIANNTAAYYGGGIASWGNVTMSGGTIANNTAILYSGGGISDWNSLVMSGGTIANNTAPYGGFGGGIETRGIFIMLDGTVANNTAGYGGGIAKDNDIGLISGGTIANNTAWNSGGGVYNRGTSITLSNTTIVNNTATLGGGIANTGEGSGIYTLVGNITISGGTIANNTAYSGGGMYNSPTGSVIVSGGTISNNAATLYGGGILNSVGNVTLMGGIIANNTAYSGGGIYTYGNFTMLDGIIANNTAPYGGGITNTGWAETEGEYRFGSVIVSGGTISNNAATLYGGGMYNSPTGSVIVSGGTISNNTAQGGGGIRNSGLLNLFGGVVSNNTAELGGGIASSGNFSMFNGIISNNIAVDGGGICLENGLVDLFSGTISENIASVDGGGVWVAYANLDHLFVYDGMVFSNNSASVAYNRNPIDDALYYAQIGPNVVWTNPFTQGYNNYDISYTNGTPYIFSYNVTVNNSYASVTGAGTYQAGEIVTINAGTRPGYTFTNWTINEGNINLTLPNTPTATFIMPESDVTVTVNWQANQSQTGSFSVTKLTNPPDTAVDFNFLTSIGASFSLTEGGDSWYSGEIPVGVYTVTELPKPGWELTNVQVDGTTNYTLNLNTRTLTFTLGADQIIALYFVNTERIGPEPGSISVTKLTSPSNSETPFSFIISAPPGTFSLTDGTTWQSGPLAPGNYTLTEIAQPGWDLANIIINDPTHNSYMDLATRTVFIAIDPGETITILYQNTKQQPQPGTITVVKTTCPTDASDVFNFVTSIPPGTFSLANADTWQSGPLAPGNYTLTEIAQADWDLTNIIISDPTGNSRVDLASRTAFIVLDPGETITILYQNTKQTPDYGSFSVTKVSCPGGSFESFRFVTSAPGGSFSLTDGSSWSSGMLPPGTYTVTELVPPGWEIANILLNDPSGTSTVDLSTGTAIINLQAETHVSIVYQDAQSPPLGGLISVVKVACPIDTTTQFSFVSSASEGVFSLGNGEVWNSGELSPGRYLVTEILQSGWVLSDIVIADPSGTSTFDLSTGTATINLQAGTHVTVIYQNTEQPHPDCCNCNKDPCQCPPCSDCHQKPCVCKPCSDCQGLHRYEVFDISLTWHEAQVFCEQLGGHLVTITS
ncbi:hypothetical protein [Candidatus Bathycorpusculum sp.]|uniref:InlB B-repeat-containing protein n=1 Tax=Candidatus Bathycorpusculum sp. TaxID=2994959 RepID=UPI00281CCAA5|nr:DUF5979 domain-containing protein [Candidatus Termitimicrobium sp.]MCL2431763.1 DUF5979 domain-containing protein [Candidatus Termitimicrobium sp.]